VPVFSVRHEPAGFRNVAVNSLTVSLPDSGGRKIQAVTAIARPESFFALLTKMAVPHQPRAYPDHHLFSAAEIDCDAFVVMTEKDAVKCKTFAGTDWWALELKLVPSPGLDDWLAGELARLLKKVTAGHDRLAE
jgi:tetraacyldisaccharide 4'-kinase